MGLLDGWIRREASRVISEVFAELSLNLTSQALDDAPAWEASVDRHCDPAHNSQAPTYVQECDANARRYIITTTGAKYQRELKSKLDAYLLRVERAIRTRFGI